MNAMLFPQVLSFLCSLSILRAKVIVPNPINNYFNIYDMTMPTLWEMLLSYSNPPDKMPILMNSPNCLLCGNPYMGTVMTMFQDKVSSIRSSLIPVDSLIADLIVLDLTEMSHKDPHLVLVESMLLNFDALKNEPQRPTILMFKFGMKRLMEKRSYDINRHHAYWAVTTSGHCACILPGIGYDLAKYILANLTTVIGVGTDLPSLESEETRRLSVTSVAELMGANGVYVLQNVDFQDVPETGCTAIALPLKIHAELGFVPTRLIAVCQDNSTPAPTETTSIYYTL